MSNKHFETIAPYTIEEAYETADAIQRGDLDDIRDELGDLLLQVVFQARIAEEAGHFDLADIATGISEKMIARHPHIFTEGTDRPSADGQKQIWEEIKACRACRQGQDRRTGRYCRRPVTDAAGAETAEARAQVGFDWPEFGQLRDKLHEEAAELEAELTANCIDQQKISDEVGDILFVAVNIARKAGVDPETAFLANKKFEKDLGYIEQILKKIINLLKDSSLEEMEYLWQEAKTATKPDMSGGKTG